MEPTTPGNWVLDDSATSSVKGEEPPPPDGEPPERERWQFGYFLRMLLERIREREKLIPRDREIE